ncbi:uncharacterized protein VTP21DRAFT_9004 [Calcarisporiella thermophila]|uniref:uncharacterized protein n=1 Tax=Calcarisporiella thermophila TaxID=911321 RepID=UPI003743C8A9
MLKSFLLRSSSLISRRYYTTTTMGRLEGKNVLITGASAGIGEACARLFAKENANLILTARRLERLDALREGILSKHPNLTVHCAQLDVRNKLAVDGLLPSLPSELQEVDVLVNNAGLVIGLDHVVDVSEEAINTMIDTNVKGLLYVTQAILKGMKERNRGHIINIGSVSGTQVYPGGGTYCGTKHFVDAITRTLLLELVSTPIRVTQINPGMVETEFSLVRFKGDKDRAEKVYEGLQPLTGEDIAELVVFAAGRPPHVNVADVLVFPVNQATASVSHREPKK